MEEAAGAGAGIGAFVGGAYVASESQSRPIPPPHRENSGRSGWNQQTSYGRAPPSSTTPDADNFGNAASGGLAGIASTVAERHARESGLDAMRGEPQGYGPGPSAGYYAQPQQSHDSPYGQPSPDGQPQYGYEHGYDRDLHRQSSDMRSDPYAPVPYNDSSPNLGPPAGMGYPSGPSTRSQQSFSSDPFRDPQSAYGQRLDPHMGQVNPNDIMDDGDDGLEYRRPARSSMLSLGSDRGSNRGTTVAAAGGAAAGLMVSHYDTARNNNSYQGAGPSEYDQSRGAKEQSEWLSKQNGSKKKWRWLIAAGIALIVIGGVVAGIIVPMLTKKSGSATGGGSSGQSASDDTAQNGDLDINSAEIKALLNNPNLHKVFPGVDYTPLNSQYPNCIHNPASQNNVTRDVAVLSQLTNVIRLYGTDCNQTQMAIHALKQLKMDKDIKIWMGVWQDGNQTTNARQLAQMWDILDEYGDEPFAGLIVANEILFREQMTTSELGTLLAAVRTNLTTRGMSLPVATSDLGDKWTEELAAVSDLIMANIHPFFGGINATDGASWTYSFWENHNSGFFKSDKSKNIISETGWPTQGGTDCGSATVTNCPDAAVAGIDELNRFMEDWVCQALANETNYFWFEMFDEPWKISFNTEGKEWEDHWGLMTVDRELKEGVKIPDCGGKTVS